MSIPVILDRCGSYNEDELAHVLDRMCRMLDLHSLVRGKKILLKPNLLTAKSPGYSCTNPGFILAVASWFIQHGADVRVGDSPAFGSARGVLGKLGILSELQNIGVSVVEFSRGREVKMVHGGKLLLAEEVFDCDLLVNLPKIKAHNQMYVTLAVKNLFGTVRGFRKAMLHVSHGNSYKQFSEMLLFLMDCLPGHVTLVDGIEVMHRSGPINGDPLMAGIVAGGRDDMAIDFVLNSLLGLDQSENPLLVEAEKKGLPCAKPENITYELLTPADFQPVPFCAPLIRKPISFHPLKLFPSAFKRFWTKMWHDRGD